MTYQPIDTYQHIEVRPTTGACGADVTGVDLSKPLEPAVKDELYKALVDNVVIFFRDQDLPPDRLAAFGEQFGHLEDEPFIPKLGGDAHPMVYGMKGATEGKLTTQNLNWHVDHSYREKPTMGIVLYAVDPPDYGGDTLFASMYKAYDDLSDAMKEFVSGLTGIHDILQYGIKSGLNSVKTEDSIEQLKIMRQHFPQIEHPLVCTHPDTGRKFLYVNPAWTSSVKELTKHEGDALLNFLFQHFQQPKFQCRFRWEKGSVAFWDNRAIVHSPIPDRFGKRIMHRVAIGTDWRPV